MQASSRSMLRSLRTRTLQPQYLASQALRAGLSTSAARSDDDKGKKSGGILKSILHGSEKAKQEAPSLNDAESAAAHASGQHSHIVGRGKYIHEVSKHKVKPGYAHEYKDLIAQYYSKIIQNDNPDVKLTGSWEVVVGDLDTFYHIWEYNGLKGLDHAMPEMAASEEHRNFQRKLAPMIQFRTTQLVQEFSFWPSSPPKKLGGIYEMRKYSLKPGSLLEWENEWKIGLEARRKFVQPIGAWFSQVGELHQVIHMWHYESLEARKQMRQKAWEIDTWSNTVAKTVKLTNRMSAQILRPLPFSPLR